MPPLRRFFSRLSEDYLLLALVLAFIPLLWWQPEQLPSLPALIDWHTMLALAGLMLLSKGLEESGYLVRFAAHLAGYSSSTRTIALLLVIFATLLSAIVTNDVALFIMVPISLSIARFTGIPAGRLVIFLALAVNAGSAVSPVGNPQNLLLWQASGYSFIQFTVMMLPLSSLLLFSLLLLTGLAFPSKALTPPETTHTAIHPHLFYLSLAGYPLFITAMELGYALPVMLLIFICYLFYNRKVILNTDWLLLLVFAFMFIDLGLLAKLPVIQNGLQPLQTLPGGDYMATALLSQFISNVPAAILMQHFSTDWRALSFGTTVGGFGLIIGSLANLIALRLAKQPGLWREFHLWSLPVFLFSLILGSLLL